MKENRYRVGAGIKEYWDGKKWISVPMDDTDIEELYSMFEFLDAQSRIYDMQTYTEYRHRTKKVSDTSNDKKS